MFDRIIEQAASRFGLAPEKARQLLGMLVSLVFSPDRGGPAGFLQSFRGQGLDSQVQSWLGRGPNDPISPAHLESALGSDALGGIARRLDLPQATVSGAAAAMLPDALDELSESGELPTSPPEGLRGWLGGFGDKLGDIGGWGGAALGAAGAGVHRATGMAGDAARATGAGINRAGDAVGDAARAGSSGMGRLLPWLLLGAAAIAAFLLFRGCQRETAMTPAPEAATTVTPAPAPAPVEPAVDEVASRVGEAATAAVERSTEAASAALDKLTPGSFSADDLVKALNLMIIHFDTGSANISADSQDILKKSAEAIKQAPAGTKIEVGGHTDNTGNAAANQKLSEARAAAVVKRLGELGVGAGMLGSKGYGQDKPVADNGTAEGRAQNRRIEFTVMK